MRRESIFGECGVHKERLEGSLGLFVERAAANMLTYRYISCLNVFSFASAVVCVCLC